MIDWLKRNKDPLDVIAQIVGAILVLIGLLFTGLQIRSGAKQIEASNIYTMQKDARELFQGSLNNDAFVDFVLRYNKNIEYDPKTIERASWQSGIIIQFYSSMHNQHRFGSVGDNAWEIAHSDLCGFFSRAPIKELWKNKLKDGYSVEFQEVVDNCP